MNYAIINDEMVVLSGDWPKTKEGSIKESIRKYEHLLDYLLYQKNHESSWNLTVPTLYTDSCALCEKYFKNGCVNCPVYKKTKKLCCDGTPFNKYEKAEEENDFDAAIKACKDEIKFLKSLL